LVRLRSIRFQFVRFISSLLRTRSRTRQSISTQLGQPCHRIQLPHGMFEAHIFRGHGHDCFFSVCLFRITRGAQPITHTTSAPHPYYNPTHLEPTIYRKRRIRSSAMRTTSPALVPTTDSLPPQRPSRQTITKCSRTHRCTPSGESLSCKHSVGTITC
jgi:hypothetical protein